MAIIERLLRRAHERHSKVVFSKSLRNADWPESRIASGTLTEEIKKLKREAGKDIMAHGGASFVQALSRLGLVDEYRLVINPVALGSGQPLFKDLAAPLHLKLIEAKTFPTGTVIRSRSSLSTPEPVPVSCAAPAPSIA